MKEGKYPIQYLTRKERNLYDTCLREKASLQYLLMKEGKYFLQYSIMKERNLWYLFAEESSLQYSLMKEGKCAIKL